MITKREIVHTNDNGYITVEEKNVLKLTITDIRGIEIDAEIDREKVKELITLLNKFVSKQSK